MTARKSRFVAATELTEIDLGDGDWVKIPARFSFGLVEDLQEGLAGTGSITKAVKILVKVIKEWNLVDADGKAAPVDESHVRQLDRADTEKLMTLVTERMGVPKA